jgi:hypothetical protein
MGEGATLKHGHEWGGKGREALEVGVEGTLTTDGIAKQEGEKVEGFIAAKAATDEVYLCGHGLEQAVRPQVLRQQNRFREPGGHRTLGRFGGL